MSQPDESRRPTNTQAMLIPPANPGPVFVEGRGSTVTDSTGRSYIDLEAGPGVSSVGHCHPRVVAAIREQAGKLLHSPGGYVSDLAASLAARLSDLTSGLLNRTFFSNSGGEANDGAVKLSLKHASNAGKRGFGILALEHANHGRQSLPLSLTGFSARKKGFGAYAAFPGVVHVPTPYCYRCPLHLKPASCGAACADVLEEQLGTRVQGEAAIMIAEPILGVGGVIVPPQEYWSKVADICTRSRITLILDEVFVGFGRTGKMFAYQNYGLQPAVMTFGKAIAGGLPLAGFTANEEVGSAFERGDHFSTFGANSQVGLAAAHAVLDVLKEENLVAAADQKGEYFMSGLRRLAERHDCIGDVRGLGLMIGIELVHDRTKRTPAPDLASQVSQMLAKQGILSSLAGLYNCVLRFTPPLVITEAEIDTVLRNLDESLAAVRR
jgi:4-aminobutyrate aminotransferase-like enzyme